MKPQNILIPTDFSVNAKNAVDFALEFFKNQNMNFTFLHAYHVPLVTPEVPTGIYYQTMEESKKIASDALVELCRKISKSSQKITCDYIVREDPVYFACSETVKEKKIDLIVMGTHGATGLKKLLFGSNAAKIIGSANCPVLAIPEMAKFWEMKKMLFATDYNDSDLDDIASLSALASVFESEIIVVHISEGKESDSAMMHWFEELIKKKINYKKINFSLLGKSDIIESLDNFIENNEVELLAMSTRERSPFQKLFSPSVTKRMAYHTKIPLFAFHVKNNNGDNF